MFRVVFIVLLMFFGVSYAKPITPLPTDIKVDERKAKLGKELFFDSILSIDNTISCSTCHDLQNGGDDGLKHSFGVNGKDGDINAPTVYNAVYNFRQQWSGEAKDLATQAYNPIKNPVEMGNNFKNLIKTMKKTPYKDKFESIYDDGITKQNIANAIAEYEKTLVTSNSPFDKYLRGDKTAITKKQREGYELFKSKGCIACHHGINIGGNLYAKFGVMRNANSKRLGRYEVTKREMDKYYFKVPTLRNISMTAPYLHDGRFKTMDEVVKFMSLYQLGHFISQDEVDKIIAFFYSLKGEIPQSAKR